MSPLHSPKQMALEAYKQRRLSSQGRLRLERHLRDCRTCQRTLTAMDSYEALRAETLLEERTVELSWERLEAALDGAASSPQTDVARPGPRKISGKVIALAWPVLALAATFVFGYLAFSGRGTPEAARAPRPTPAIPATLHEEAASHGWITLVAASAEIEIGGKRVPARPGQQISEGARLFTGAGAELHVALADGSGLVVGAATELSITRLRVRSVELALQSGEVSQQVHKLTADERYEVALGSYVAKVRGTQFRVSQADSSSVAVSEGRVVVYEQGQIVADLGAGQDWDSLSSAARGPSHARRVHGLGSSSQQWPTLTLPPLSNVVSWRVDDQSLPAPGGIAMRMPAGDLVLKYEDARGRERSLSLKVAPEGTALSEQSIRELIAAQNDPRGQLDPEQIAPVVRAGLDSLRRCYERALKRDPQLVAKLVLSIRVAPDGHVARAEVDGAQGPRLPLDVESCIQAEARGWVFPKPSGGYVVFEVPLNLRAAH